MIPEPPAPGLVERLRAPLQSIAGAAAGLAGTAAFVYLLGGAVMWVRLTKAHLPADQTMSLVPRNLLLVVGIRRVILPAATAGISFYLLSRLESAREKRQTTEQRKKKKGDTASGKPQSETPARKLSKRVQRRVAIPVVAVLPAIIAWVIFTPFTLRTFVAALALAAPIVYHQWLCDLWENDQRREPFPAHRVAVLAVLAVTTAVLVRQWDLPHSFERVTIVLSEKDRPLSGSLVSLDSEAVNLAVGGELVVVPRQTVSRLHLRPPQDIKKPPSIAELLSGYRDREIVIATGPRERRLTDDWANDTSPDWSGDGRIAYRSDRDGDFDIYVADSRGASLRQVTDNPAFDGGVAWSPDGQNLAFVTSRDGNSEIYVVSADGSDPKRLTRNSTSDGSPVWSPDGKQIAFETSRHGSYDIYLMEADGSEQRPVVTDPADDRRPAFAPDGKGVAFDTVRDGNLEIYVKQMPDGEETRLTPHSSEDRRPVWAPDGERIAFESSRDGDSEIYVMSSDGTRIRAITSNNVDDRAPAWSPDGTSIAFTRLVEKGFFN